MSGRLSLTVTMFLGRSRSAPGAPQPAATSLEQAMTSFFSDVADLDRELFNDGMRLRPLDVPAAVTLEVGPALSWQSESLQTHADLGRALQFTADCVAFSCAFADRREALSVSLQIRYDPGLPNYLALAALQDALLDGGGAAAAVRVMTGAPAPAPGLGLRAFVESFAAGRPVRLLRWACVFEDALLFKAVADRDALLDAAYADAADGRSGSAAGELTRALGAVAAHAPPNRYDAATLARWSAEWSVDVQALLFMSGFSQGLIDFLRQDGSEVDDGSNPLYPAAGEGPARRYWFLYANENAVVEVARALRSVDAASRFIGTCPYLLLVHLRVMHNEALTLLHERYVRRMVRNVEKLRLHQRARGGAAADPARARALAALVNRFRQRHVEDVLRVERYLHGNVFRYATERAFFAAIEGVRGTDRRRQRWADVVGKLVQTSDDQAKALSEIEQNRLNLTAAALAVIGLFSIALSIPQSLRDWKLWPSRWPEHASHLAYLLMLGALVWIMWRTSALLARLLNRLNTERAGAGRRLGLLAELRGLLLRGKDTP